MVQKSHLNTTCAWMRELALLAPCFQLQLSLAGLQDTILEEWVCVWAFPYLSQQQEDSLAQPQPLEHQEVVGGRHGQHRHALLLPQHAGGGAPQAGQQPAPAPLLAVPGVTQQGEQEEEGGAHVGPAHHTCHRLGVDWVRGEKEACQQAPRAAGTQQRATDGGEEARDQGVQCHVKQVVAPGAQAVQGVVEAEGERAKWPEGLVAAAVGEQSAPKVVVQDVGPRRLRQEVLVGLDGSAARSRGGEEG